MMRPNRPSGYISSRPKEPLRDIRKKGDVAGAVMGKGWQLPHTAKTVLTFLVHPAPVPDAAAREKFLRLKSQWLTEIGSTSSPIEMILHPAYQQIIGMGPVAVPLLLRELQTTPFPWFWALKAITGEDPAIGANSTDKVTQAWLDWGRKHGHIA